MSKKLLLAEILMQLVCVEPLIQVAQQHCALIKLTFPFQPIYVRQSSDDKNYGDHNEVL